MKSIVNSIKSFINKFPYRIVSEKERSLVNSMLVEKASYSNERSNLLLEIERLKTRINSLSGEKTFIDPDLGDPSPLDTESRKTYVSRVSGVFKDILEPKIVQMLSAFHNLLEESTNIRDDDQAIKGAIYMCREFIKWGNLMISEHMAFMNSDHPSSEE